MVKQAFVAFSVFAFLALGAGVSIAAHPDTGPGCGLGKLAWSDYPNHQHIGPQVLMVTTNGTGFNTFAISSGTSGCTNDGVVVENEKVNVFAALNFDNIAQDMAQGNGEYLTSLASLMGVPSNQHQDFCQMAQEKYTTLVRSGESSPKAVIAAIHDAMMGHPVLVKVSAPQ